MREYANLIRAYAQEKAAGEQQKIADGCRPSFRSDAEVRERWKTEEECARGAWRSERRAAWAATQDFLRTRG